MRRFTIFCLVFSLITGSAFAQQISDRQFTNRKPAKDWQFEFSPYLLAPSIDGNLKAGRIPSADLSVSPSDIFKNLDFGLMGHYEARYDNRISITLDMAYMDVNAGRSISPTGGKLEAGVKQLITEGFAGYRYWQRDQDWLEAYGGVRWWHNKISVSAEGPLITESRTITEDWVDPVIGLRGKKSFNDKWALYGSANIGGFGIVSDFTWSLLAGVDYRFNDQVALQLQYKAVGVDYNNDESGKDTFIYDTVTHGPLVGVSFRF